MAIDDDQARLRETARRAAPKAPVTIDLAAERIEPASAESAAKRPDAEADPAAPAPGTRPRAPGPEASPQAAPRREPPAAALRQGRRAVFVLGLIGGAVVALALAYLLLAVGVLRAPGRDEARAASAAVEALTADIDALRRQLEGARPFDAVPLEARLAALEAAALARRPATPTAPDVTAALAANAARADQLAADLATLQRDMLAAGAAGGDPGAAARLTEAIAEIEARIIVLERAGPPAQVIALQRRVDQLAAEAAALAATVATLADTAGQRGDTEAVALALALAGVRTAAAAGQPFAAELAALGGLGIDPAAVAALDPFAGGDVPPLADLATAFPATADAVLAATTTLNPDAGFWERLWANARDVVTVRPTGPIEGATPTAILSRMQAAIDAGDLPAALSERSALLEAGLAASAAWAAGAIERVALDAAVAALGEAVRRQQQSAP